MANVNRVQEYEQARTGGRLEGARDEVVQTFESYPLATALGVFGVGFALGSVIGCALAHRPAPEHTAAAIGRRVLDSISEYLPHSLRG